ncbi:hypothetical protein T01_1930 [Trichinella spiralis]|uniref:Uncharacterized protein n=1 Tax=Trichinella spiralis TaxID=6334 RepID=A0A0V1B0A4_TRISP|nr:hypothetical protein T01_1930 [Trichinella spiralis]
MPFTYSPNYRVFVISCVIFLCLIQLYSNLPYLTNGVVVVVVAIFGDEFLNDQAEHSGVVWQAGRQAILLILSSFKLAVVVCILPKTVVLVDRHLTVDCKPISLLVTIHQVMNISLFGNLYVIFLIRVDQSNQDPLHFELISLTSINSITFAKNMFGNQQANTFLGENNNDNFKVDLKILELFIRDLFTELHKQKMMGIKVALRQTSKAACEGNVLRNSGNIMIILG